MVAKSGNQTVSRPPQQTKNQSNKGQPNKGQPNKSLPTKPPARNRPGPKCSKLGGREAKGNRFQALRTEELELDLHADEGELEDMDQDVIPESPPSDNSSSVRWFNGIVVASGPILMK